MKVAVIGNGNVGKAVFRELQSFREINELVLVGRNAAYCRAEAEDYLDAIPLRVDAPTNLWGGGYSLAKDADILVYAAGPSVTKEDRLSVASKNIEVAKEVFSKIDKYAPNAIVIVVTNPLDVITTAITKITGRPSNKVIGTGTLLDTARLIKILSWALKISPSNITGLVVGEHGNSSVVLNSSIRILGMAAADFVESNKDKHTKVLAQTLRDFKKLASPIVDSSKNSAGTSDASSELEAEVRDAGFKIFRGKGYTSAGISAAVARIVFDIINNTKRMYPVSTVLHGEYGVDGFAISVPCMIGKNGIEGIQNIQMTDSERKEFQKSAAIIKKACSENGVMLKSEKIDKYIK